MQETLHNHIGSNESIDDVEAIDNGNNKSSSSSLV